MNHAPAAPPRRPRRALLICNGEQPMHALAARLARRADFIVAADGGANGARGHGIRPDVIIGDLDSIRPATRRHFASVRLIHEPRQDNTDMEKALDFLGAMRSIRDVIIIGTTGSRVDFTLGNFSLLWNYVRRFNLVVAGDGWHAMPVGSNARVRASVGSTVSLIPFGRCSDITLTGLRYTLSNASMRVGETGMSNVVASSPFSVSVRRGRMLMFVMEDYSAR